MSEPTPKRWFRFSPRTLLIAMLLLGAGLGFLGTQLRVKERYAPVWEDDKGRIHVQSPGFADQIDRRGQPSPEAARVRDRYPEATILVEDGNVLYYTWRPGEA